MLVQVAFGEEKDVLVNVRAVVLGLRAADNGTLNAEVALADRSIVLKRSTIPKKSTKLELSQLKKG